MRRRRFDLHRSQVSVSYYIPEEERQRGSPDYFAHVYAWMLIEDVSTGIMPIGGRSERRQFSARLVPAERNTERMIAEALGRRHERELGAALCDFVRDCAQAVMHYGEAVYEVVYVAETEGGEPSGFDLALIQPNTVVRRWGGLAQYVPLSIAEERGLPTYIRLPADRLIEICPLAYKQGKVRKALEALVTLSGKLVPEFALESGTGGQAIPFDFTEYERAHKAALAAAAREIGWNARGLLQNEALEYYWLERHLRFEEFKARLRDEIIASLREGLVRVGRRFGFNAHLEVEGLPSIDDVRRARARLTAGEGTFKEIIESVTF
jgi:hypothetical protein